MSSLMAKAGSNDLTILLVQTAAGAHEQGAFNNVQLTAVAVPEPASIGLLCGGAILMIRRRRRPIAREA
jgi:hypothetical protein